MQHVTLVACLGSLQGVSGNEVTAWVRAGGSGRGEGTVNKNSEWEERMGFIDGPDSQSTKGEELLGAGGRKYCGLSAVIKRRGNK